jgi:hypothetical protein
MRNQYYDAKYSTLIIFVGFVPMQLQGIFLQFWQGTAEKMVTVARYGFFCFWNLRVLLPRMKNRDYPNRGRADAISASCQPAV